MYVWLIFEQKVKGEEREELGWPQMEEERENKASFSKLRHSHNHDF